MEDADANCQSDGRFAAHKRVASLLLQSLRRGKRSRGRLHANGAETDWCRLATGLLADTSAQRADAMSECATSARHAWPVFMFRRSRTFVADILVTYKLRATEIASWNFLSSCWYTCKRALQSSAERTAIHP